MKKSERACIIMQILTENPNKDYPLGYFAELFKCAKSSVSEDIKLIRGAMDAAGYGYVETTSGSRGGVRYVPYISNERSVEILTEIKNKLEEPDRRLGAGFLYTSDIMFSPELSRGAAEIFAKHFASTEADVVITVETKGIPVAAFTADLLHLPLVVIRRESRISDGSTVSINFFSGSSERLQKMSLSKRAVTQGTRAIIIDDYMHGGGSIKGIEDMLSEFGARSAGVGVMIASGNEWYEESPDRYPLLLVNEESDGSFHFEINPRL